MITAEAVEKVQQPLKSFEKSNAFAHPHLTKYRHIQIAAILKNIHFPTTVTNIIIRFEWGCDLQKISQAVMTLQMIFLSLTESQGRQRKMTALVQTKGMK